MDGWGEKKDGWMDKKKDGWMDGVNGRMRPPAKTPPLPAPPSSAHSRSFLESKNININRK